MTYRQLLEKLQSMSDDLLDLDVTVCLDSDECSPVITLEYAQDEGLLDEGHPVLVVL